MQLGLVLFSPPEAVPCDPELLAAAHPVLQREAEVLGPWEQVDLPAPFASTAPAWHSARAVPATVLVCGECASSLDIAWRLQTSGLLHAWDCVLALSQRAGRGQMRHLWLSPAGNIYVALRLPRSLAELGDIAPLLVGRCLAAALRGLGVPVLLKWPNDLLLHDTKVGGILLEERGGALMAGVGVNLISAPDAEVLRRDPLAPKAGTLHTCPELADMGPLKLWLRILAGAREEWARLENTDPRNLGPVLEEFLAWKGRRVMLRESGGTQGDFDKYGGRIVGIGGDGALHLRHEGGETALRSGSIALAKDRAPRGTSLPKE